MYIDEALKIVMDELKGILIPASESEKMQNVKNGIQGVITAVQNQRTQEQQSTDQEEQSHED